MYCFDGHVHTRHSFDSKAEMAQQCAAAADAGLQGLCFTEHFSLNSYAPTFGYLNWNDYNADYTKCREKYNGRLLVCKGIEICEPHLQKKNYQGLSEYQQLDVVIGAVHNVAHTKLRALVAAEGARRALRIYLGEYLQMVTYADIDVAAHLDLVKRYTNAMFSEPIFQQNQDLLEDILNKMIARGIALEMNTSSLDKLGETMPNPLVLSLYAKLGGELLTFGSDAHSPERLAQGFTASAALAKELGFSVFVARAPVLHSFAE